MTLMVAGCAQLADLGAGSVADATPDGGTATGPRTDANITITPSRLDFGEVACGSESAAQLVKIVNSGSAATPYKVEIPTGTALRVEGALNGMIPAKQAVTLSVFATPRVAGDFNATDLFVTAGEALQPIHATAKGTGATFELVQSSISFGDVRKENGAPPVDVEVRNSGTKAVSVSDFIVSKPDAFSVTWQGQPAAFTIAPQTSAHLLVTMLTATSDDAAALTETIKPKETKFCGAPPILTMTGRRVTSNVTLSTGDWGRQDCNSTPKSKDIVITNYANAVVTYSVQPVAGSAFTILDEGPHSIALAPTAASPQTAAIKVVPKPLPATAPLPNLSELLGVTLASTAPGINGRHDVTLHVDVRGAIITITPAALTFTSTGAASDRKTFTVENTGNEGAYLSWSLNRTSTNGGSSWSIGAPQGIGGSSTGAKVTTNGTVDFQPPAAAGVEVGLATATLTPRQPFYSNAAECKSFGSVTLTGNKP